MVNILTKLSSRHQSMLAIVHSLTRNERNSPLDESLQGQRLGRSPPTEEESNIFSSHPLRMFARKCILSITHEQRKLFMSVGEQGLFLDEANFVGSKRV